MKNPIILLLDEDTSTLGIESEQVVQDALVLNQTNIVIAVVKKQVVRIEKKWIQSFYDTYVHGFRSLKIRSCVNISMNIIVHEIFQTNVSHLQSKTDTILI